MYNFVIQVNFPKLHLRVAAPSNPPDRTLNTNIPPSSGNLRETAQNHSPDGFGYLEVLLWCTCYLTIALRLLVVTKWPFTWEFVYRIKHTYRKGNSLYTHSNLYAAVAFKFNIINLNI